MYEKIKIMLRAVELSQNRKRHSKGRVNNKYVMRTPRRKKNKLLFDTRNKGSYKNMFLIHIQVLEKLCF